MIRIVDDPKSNISPEILEKLTTGTGYPFSEGLHAGIPLAKAGVYTIWRGSEFIYVGIAGRGLDLTIEHKRMRGIRDRIGSHWYGRRSGDQFGVYVCDRLVLPELTPEQISRIGAGDLSLDALTRVYIHQHLSYRFAVLPSFAEAMAIEDLFASGGTSSGKPFLNPKKAKGVRRSASNGRAPSPSISAKTPGEG
jgi:hypothetical protein